MMKRVEMWMVIGSVFALAGAFAGCGAEEGESYETVSGALVEHLETDSLMVGEPLSFYGQNFLTPDEGRTRLILYFEASFEPLFYHYIYALCLFF